MTLNPVCQKPLLRIENMVKHFPIKKGVFKPKEYVKAVNNITLSIDKGETYGLVGESGCGKSTTGRAILRLIEPTSGEVYFENEDLGQMNREELRMMRKNIQIVFQDPYSALNPRMSIGKAIEEPMNIFSIGAKEDRKKRAIELLRKVGINQDQYNRKPHEFSGGQRQRIVLARALAVKPKFIVCDEAVSALDVSIQSQIINLLEELQNEFDLTYLFIAHDLSVVRHLSDRIGVMYLGNLVEEGPTDLLFSNTLHPYTQALLSAIPNPNPKASKQRVILSGDVPSPLNPPTGCAFHTRCPQAKSECKVKTPIMKEVESGHKVACHLY